MKPCKKEKPKCQKQKHIIAEHLAEFMEWHEMRKHVPVLKAVKTKLQEIHTCRLFISQVCHNTSSTAR